MKQEFEPHELIGNHGFEIKVRNWARYANRCDDYVISLIQSVLNTQLVTDSEVRTYLGRQDVTNAFKEDLAKGIAAAIIWVTPKAGFPAGEGLSACFTASLR